MIPIKWVPYLLIALGIFGAIAVARSEAPDKVSGTVVCVLAAIGGVIWAAINIIRSKRNKEQ